MALEGTFIQFCDKYRNKYVLGTRSKNHQTLLQSCVRHVHLHLQNEENEPEYFRIKTKIINRMEGDFSTTI